MNRIHKAIQHRAIHCLAMAGIVKKERGKVVSVNYNMLMDASEDFLLSIYGCGPSTLEYILEVQRRIKKQLFI